jgi:hypothetical protein
MNADASPFFYPAQYPGWGGRFAGDSPENQQAAGPAPRRSPKIDRFERLNDLTAQRRNVPIPQ